MAHSTATSTESQLIEDLEKLSLVNRKLVKSTPYAAPADPGIMVRSWKMNEFKYYQVPSPFPTLARGLFSIERPSEGEGSKSSHRIVIRGYDKFFNIGEVPWTTWPSIEARTAAPYVLTLKSNGCIIFIGALTPSRLLITSKHAIGNAGESDKPATSHAEVGEQWLKRYLAQKNKTEEQLANVLWENNWTAIAELCDDSFEEHVLAYPPEKTGLHLHGINESTKAFKTLPQAEVDAFAEEWGFINTESIVLDSAAEVKDFTDKIAETGVWNGEAVEGFVVRTHIVKPKEGTRETAASPYPPGSTFFFKIKFDEPYMMYRDWRELTKTLLSTKGSLNDAKLSTMRMKRPETKLYVKWVKEQIQKNRSQFDEYSKGKGIIRTRERFLEWMAANKVQGSANAGEKIVDVAVDATPVDVKPAIEFGKTIIVPVAVPGCGKTAISVALQHLFGFGHTQSDDVHVKKAAPQFIKNVVNMLKKHDVVIADKNNHLRQHRQALRDATAKMSPPVRLLALYWPLDQPHATIHKVCCERINLRGDNHQSLRADKDRKHEDVLWRFLTETDELLSDEVDDQVVLDVTANLEDGVRKAAEGCARILGLPQPTKQEIQEALDVISGYAVTTKKATRKKDGDGPTPRYFGLLPEVDLEKLVDETLRSQPNLPEDCTSLWAEMKKNGRVTKRPHVTITHQKFADADKELWDQCLALHRLEVPPSFKFKLGRIMWNERVMAVTVEDLEVDVADGDGRDLAESLVSRIPKVISDRLHITVGTRTAQIPAVEAMAMVQARQEVEELGVKLEGVEVKGSLRGLFS